MRQILNIERQQMNERSLKPGFFMNAKLRMMLTCACWTRGRKVVLSSDSTLPEAIQLNQTDPEMLPDTTTPVTTWRDLRRRLLRRLCVLQWACCGGDDVTLPSTCPWPGRHYHLRWLQRTRRHRDSCSESIRSPICQCLSSLGFYRRHFWEKKRSGRRKNQFK